MRRNFAQVLKQANIDIEEEYSRLYMLFYKNRIHGTPLREIINNNILSFGFRGTSLTLDDFDKVNGFAFKEYPVDFNLDFFVNFCEYIYNIIKAWQFSTSSMYNVTYETVDLLFKQIYLVIESIGYMQSQEGNITIFVEKSPAAIAVSEVIPLELSFKAISYNHHSMKGNLEAKKDTLLKFAHLLEVQRAGLGKTISNLDSDLFFIFNNFNIRHNNFDPADANNYRESVANMPKTVLEHWYDETYQMCLLAFLEIEHSERKKQITAIKRSMN